MMAWIQMGPAEAGTIWFLACVLALGLAIVVAPLFIWSHLAKLNRQIEWMRTALDSAVQTYRADHLRKVFRCPECEAEVEPHVVGSEFACKQCGAILAVEDRCKI